MSKVRVWKREGFLLMSSAESYICGFDYHPELDDSPQVLASRCALKVGMNVMEFSGPKKAPDGYVLKMKDGTSLEYVGMFTAPSTGEKLMCFEQMRRRVVRPICLQNCLWACMAFVILPSGDLGYIDHRVVLKVIQTQCVKWTW